MEKNIEYLLSVYSKVKDEIASINNWFNNSSFSILPNSLYGVYCIKDKDNNIIYYGKAENQTFFERWSQHKRDLINNEHTNKKLQDFFNNECNRDLTKISFNIVEELPRNYVEQDTKKTLITIRETYYINKNQGTIFNKIIPSIVDIEEINIKIKKQSDESKKVVEQINSVIAITAEGIHDYFRKLAVTELTQPLIISCILLALGNDDFLKSYKHFSEPEIFLNNFEYAIKNTIKNYKNFTGNKDLLFSYMNNALLEIKKIQGIVNEEQIVPLKKLTELIEISVFDLSKKHSNYDILQNFYNSFTKYNSTDQKSKGIVLTPQVVAELMSNLLEIKNTDTILDLTSGTGSLLMSANGADGENNNMIASDINENMIFFTLSNSIIRNLNMHIMLADALNPATLEIVKNKNPNKAIMNPPYGDHFIPLQFIYNALNCLQPNGKLACIVPIGDARGKTQYNELILKHHTLDAVITMPPDTFKGIGVHPVVMLFTAHKPNDTNKTFLAEIEDFQLVTVKNKGKQDLNGNWKNIKNKILKSFFDKEEIQNETFLINLSADSEWISKFYKKPTAGMYFNLLKSECIKEIVNFYNFKQKNAGFFNETESILQAVVYAKRHSLTETWSSKIDLGNVCKILNIGESLISEEVDLNSLKIKEIKIGDLFEVIGGHGITIESAKNSVGNYPLISSSGYNNGIAKNNEISIYTKAERFMKDRQKIKEIVPFKGNSITVAKNGSVGDSFYQENDFVTTSDVVVLVPIKEKINLNKYLSFYFTSSIYIQSREYNWSAKLRNEDIENLIVKVPVMDNGEIDFYTIEKFVKSLTYSSYI
jgi:tRNA G10  N-methylase Trm11